MKKFTVEEFDSLPVVNGLKRCPKGDYSLVRYFGHRCVFDEGCRFGNASHFGEQCVFGKDCSFGNRCSFGMSCTFGSNCAFGNECVFGMECVFSLDCTFGTRSNFGAVSAFGSGCRFGKHCTFGGPCSFAETCYFDGRRALPGHPVLAMSSSGFANKVVYAFNVEGGPMIEVGDFSGDLDAFRAKVLSEKENSKLKCLNEDTKYLQFLWFANLVEASWIK